MLPSTGRRLVAACLVVVGLSLLAAGAGGLAATAVDAAASSADGTAATPPEPVSGLDLPERVELAGTPTGGSVAVGVDVGAGIHGDGVAVDAAYDRELLAQRFARAETDEERREVLAGAVERANHTTSALRAYESRARADYRAGSIDEVEFVSRLRAVDDLAASRSTVLAAASDHVDGVDGDLERDAEVLQGGFAARQGEVRSIVGEAVTGERTVQRVYVATDGDGIVLASIDGASYHREANRDDLYENNRSDGIGFDALQELLQTELYPQFRASNDWSLMMEAAADAVYRVGGNHDYGRLHLFVDASTGDVFREHHELDLDEHPPTRPATTATSDTAVLEVNRTYPSGPALVVVTDAGQPVEDAPVTVGGEVVATTDDEGTAWVVLPYGPTEVSTAVDDIDVTVGISWNGDGGDPDDESSSEGGIGE